MRRGLVGDAVCVAASVVLLAMSVESIVNFDRRLYEFVTGIVCAAFCLLPMALRRFHILTLPTWFVVLIEVAIFFHAYGVLLMNYDFLVYYDTLTHTLSSCVISVCVYLTLFFLQRTNSGVRLGAGLLALFVFLIMMSFGSLWEVLEYVVDQSTGTHMQYSPFDTVRDMLANAFGSVLGSALMFLYVRHRPLDDLLDSIDLHPKLKAFLSGRQ